MSVLPETEAIMTVCIEITVIGRFSVTFEKVRSVISAPMVAESSGIPGHQTSNTKQLNRTELILSVIYQCRSHFHPMSLVQCDPRQRDLPARHHEDSGGCGFECAS
jgi:hypothetical protein